MRRCKDCARPRKGERGNHGKQDSEFHVFKYMRAGASRRVRGITLRVACAQLLARPVAQAREALADIIAAIRKARRHEASLLILPECSYPGYVLLDSHPYRHAIPSDAEALHAISREARRAKVTVVVGIARTRPDDSLRNEAVLIDAQGDEIGSYAKARLWNFDHRWFRPGRDVPVFETAFGRIGMMICADGRNPEIARTLAAKGAWLVADPTAWVGFGPSHAQIRNVQADFMLRVRALENGIWIAAADKCGSELGAVHYAGYSQIVAPDGSIATCAAPAQPQFIAADIQRTKPAPYVSLLTAGDRKALRMHPRKNGRLRPLPPRLWIAMYQSAPRRRDDPLTLQALAVQGVSAVIRTGASRATMTRSLERVRGLRFTILTGEAMVAPEPARAAALRGADLLLWRLPPSRLPVIEIARTRAVENRVYVALCSHSDGIAASMIHPDGSIVGSALTGEPSGFVAVVDTIAARRKEVVPGTQTFADRLPNAYRWLDRATGVVVS